MQKKQSKPGPGSKELLTRLPAVSTLLDQPGVGPLVEAYGARLVTDLLRELVDRLRAEVLGGRHDAQTLAAVTEPEAVAAAVLRAAEELTAARPRPTINATGVVVHTNLGRATLSDRAAQALAAAARGYVDLEYDLVQGRRGSRFAALEPVMARLFPGRGFTVVNNNAAAVMLCLRALSCDREVLVSRGELVEIGGSFRIPDVMAASGARLREVGTTNRTRAADYVNALSGETGLILKVHTSNFKIVGFTEEAGIAELAAVAREGGVPLVVDWGSGDLVELGPLGIRDELPVSRVLAEGADLVTFSADKLLGGPQAGFIVGDAELVARIRRDPLSRVCRLDRLRLGALQQTLVAYVTGREFDEVPTLRMLAAEPAAIERRARDLLDRVTRRTAAEGRMEIVDGVSRTGGGSSPAGERPTRLIAISSPSGDAGLLEQLLRTGEPPVIGRVQEGKLLLDLRTVQPAEETMLVERLVEALDRDERSTSTSG